MTNKNELNEIWKIMFAEYPDIITISQLQQMLGIGRHSAYNLISDGYISGAKIGRGFKIPKISVIQYLMNNNHSSFTLTV